MKDDASKAKERIAELQEEIRELERRHQEDVLVSLGLYEEREEILNGGADLKFEALREGFESRVVNGETQYYRKIKDTFDVSPEEYAQINELLEKKAEIESESIGQSPGATDESKSSNRMGASFFKGIAWFLWIGGLVLAR